MNRMLSAATFAAASFCVLALTGCNEPIANPVDAANEFDRQMEANDNVVVPPATPVSPSARVGEAVPGSRSQPGAVRTAAALRPADPYTDLYDRNTVMTFRGPVLGLRRIPLANDKTGLFIEVKQGGEIPPVYLGPQDWLFDHQITPAITNEVVVTGSVVQADGAQMMIAREITLRDVHLELRDEAGQPRWPIPAADETAAPDAAD